ncbi:hypothetical protein LQG66_25275 [Bradyrhizobium ontarionense]|uniref:Uncharacterized protein n=1 Tax=Bradyrhizobium ontarionense TaxID=2898149 RepID=A0ABY3R6E3_9BRAD|nr:hypothetical protein [Bradyrhizobium sp. A19]UFZ02577.1 hypothetical protein LQG66_25275 [Bradyrhizobium sp. A19]
MPFIYDETQIEWPEDGSEPAPPRASDFVYLPSPEFGGVKEPVQFSLDAPAEVAAPAPADEGTPPFVSGEPPRRSILDRLFRRWSPAASQQRRDRKFERQFHRAKLEHQRRSQLLLSTMIPPLRAAGARRAYCRYDGGNDEGFSWLDHYESERGNRIDLNVLAERLFEMNVHDRLRDAGFGLLTATSKDQKLAELRGFASGWLVDDWATRLFGGSFGTGEYSMFGAFWVDLETCTITDDPNAEPAVQNITIAE